MCQTSLICFFTLDEAAHSTLAPTGRSTRGEATPWMNKIVAAPQQLINQDLGRSMRLMTRELGLTRATVQKKMSEDISNKSHA